MRVFLLGAGASHSYDSSPTGIRPPLAHGFFEALPALGLPGNLDVPMGNIVNYVERVYGIPPTRFGEFDPEIEQFLTELESYLERSSSAIRNGKSNVQEALLHFGAYGQTLWLLSMILNAICNGPTSRQYAELIAHTDRDDVFVTLNWDTLLDRALWETGEWSPDQGYGFEPRGILDGEWRPPVAAPLLRDGQLLKLHGSVNWLVG